MMLRVKGDLFSFAFYKNGIVVPANIGWTKRGLNVMGRGVAKQAAKVWPILPSAFGFYCRTYGTNARVAILAYNVIFFPVKPLNEAAPYLSWQGKADINLVEKSTQELAALPGLFPIYLPLVGCGNCGLNKADVLPILERHLNDRFTLVEL